MSRPPAGRPAAVRPAERRRIAAIYDRLAGHIDPRSDLVYGSTFELLVAVVLSAQATDVSVNLATAKLFPRANTPAAILALGEDGLAPYIRTIGLWRMKARNVIGLCAQLLDRHGGEVPADRAALEALPGVGRKTANVVLNLAFGQPTIAVDTHVQRVANRLGLCTTTTPDATEAALMRLTPPEHLVHAHHYLILHGRYICTARSPRCADCVISAHCPSRS
jgi:endonuclease-3